MNADRTIPDDWHPGRVPENVRVGPSAYIQTSYSFKQFRSRRADAVEIGEAASIYLGVMFDMGRDAQLSIGAYCLLNGVRIICDSQIIIGPYSLISWNVVLMDSYRFSFETAERCKELEGVLVSLPDSSERARPIRIGSNVWIGFDSCVLPGVTIGDGSVVGARSVVNQDVPPYTVVAGNPARVIRSLSPVAA
jgi:tetrahydrodipicolinate N-succinyltransferase